MTVGRRPPFTEGYGVAHLAHNRSYHINLSPLTPKWKAPGTETAPGVSKSG